MYRKEAESANGVKEGKMVMRFREQNEIAPDQRRLLRGMLQPLMKLINTEYDGLIL